MAFPSSSKADGGFRNNKGLSGTAFPNSAACSLEENWVFYSSTIFKVWKIDTCSFCRHRWSFGRRQQFLRSEQTPFSEQRVRCAHQTLHGCRYISSPPPPIRTARIKWMWAQWNLNRALWLTINRLSFFNGIISRYNSQFITRYFDTQLPRTRHKDKRVNSNPSSSLSEKLVFYFVLLLFTNLKIIIFHYLRIHTTRGPTCSVFRVKQPIKPSKLMQSLVRQINPLSETNRPSCGCIIIDS